MNPDKDVLIWDCETWNWTRHAMDHFNSRQRTAIRRLVDMTYWEARILKGRIEHTFYQTFENNIYMRRS